MSLDHRELCVPQRSPVSHRSRYLLARSVIKRHLSDRISSSHPSLIINSFPSLESDHFKEYLHEFPIHFVMSHDGSNSTTKNIARTTTETDIFAKVLLRGIIWWFNLHKLNVALINHIEFRDSKVFTMIVESFSPSNKLRLTMTTKFVREISESRKFLEDIINLSNPSKVSTISDAHLHKVVPLMSEEVLSRSAYLAAHAVSDVLESKDCGLFMGSAFMLHNILLTHLSLSQRRLPLITFDEKFDLQIEEFLANFADAARHLLEDHRSAAFFEADEISSGFIDIVDGRLFRAVIQAMCDNTFNRVVPETVQSDWNIVSRIIRELTNQHLTLNSSILPKSSEIIVENGTTGLELEELSVLPFSMPVFDKHLECIHVKTDASLPLRMGAMKIYRETSHWHNHRRPLNPKLAPIQNVSKWRYVLDMS